jgi:hypothetical protein
LHCEDTATGERVDVDDVVTVYGPFSHATASARAEQFNKTHGENDDGSPRYQPVDNAPGFLHVDKWTEHWAIARTMNDVEW